MSNSPNALSSPIPEALLLLAEATKLGNALAALLSEIAALAPQVNTILASAIATSSSARTKSILQEAIDKHADLIRAGASLPNHSQVILERFKQSKHEVALRTVLALLDNIDVDKLADEELLAQCTRARQTIEQAPEVWAIQVSAVHIPLYSLPFFHLNLLREFLNRPSRLDQTFSGAIALFKAVAKDLAGEAVPFLGVLETVFELTTPAMERDVESMRHATNKLDRLFQFDDALTNVMSHARYVEAAIRFADDSTRAYSLHFERDATWLATAL